MRMDTFCLYSPSVSSDHIVTWSLGRSHQDCVRRGLLDFVFNWESWYSSRRNPIDYVVRYSIIHKTFDLQVLPPPLKQLKQACERLQSLCWLIPLFRALSHSSLLSLFSHAQSGVFRFLLFLLIDIDSLLPLPFSSIVENTGLWEGPYPGCPSIVPVSIKFTGNPWCFHPLSWTRTLYRDTWCLQYMYMHTDLENYVSKNLCNRHVLQNQKPDTNAEGLFKKSSLKYNREWGHECLYWMTHSWGTCEYDNRY